MKLSEISKQLNVSNSTVSRVINNKPGVNPKTRKIVKSFLIENKIIKDDDNNNIAVIVPDLENPYFGEIVKEVSHILLQKDYQVSIYDTDENIEIEEKVIKNIIKNRVAGVVFCISDGFISAKHVEMLQESKIPLILFDRELDSYLDGVFLNDFQSGAQATEKLIEKGCKNIALIHGDMSLKHVSNRCSGYKYTLAKNNIPINDKIIFEGDMKIESGFQIMKTISNSFQDVDGILILNNFMTIGAINYINNTNIDLYDKFKIFGYDIPDYVHGLNPKFNYVARSRKDMGKQIAKLILKKITDKNYYMQKIIIDPVFK